METVLDKEVHAPLIRNMDHYAAQARVPKHYITQPCKDKLAPKEYEWFLNLRTHVTHEVYGLAVAHGVVNDVAIEHRMFSAVGWCLRNYIDARIFTLPSLTKLEEPETPTVMVIIGVGSVAVSDWACARFESLLFERMANQQLTVIDCNEVEVLRAFYGDSIAALVSAHYIIL